MQQLNWSLNNVLPGTYYDWSDCILTHENILANSDLRLSTILLVSAFTMTTSLMFIFTGFSLWLRLCLSLIATKYSWTHLFQDASLHLCICLCRFFQLSLTSSSSRYSSSNLISLTRIIEFDVNNEYSKSSSIYVNVRLFRLTLTL